MLSNDQLLAEVTSSTAVLAALIDGADLTRQVPTCPEWTLRQLITHVGRVHRWAARNIAAQAAEPVPFREVPGGRLPDDPREHPRWLTDGAALAAREVRAAGPEPIWTPAGMLPGAAWARRMAHETAVHRADGQITFGQQPVIDPVMATDGIDEWLSLLARHGATGDGQAGALSGGRTLHIHTTDGGPGAAGEWLVRAGPGGLTVEPRHGKGDVAVRGPACPLLLMLVRRVSPDTPGVEVLGDRALLDAWLAATPY